MVHRLRRRRRLTPGDERRFPVVTRGSSGQLPLDLPHKASLARDDLIVTDANRLAVAAVDGWPAWPHPVLLVVGPPGAGKSHLVAAWAAVSGARPLTEGEPGDLTRRFAVTLDDVDRSPIDEARIFDVVNTARLGGGFVLATARSRPSAMAFVLADLRSRLQAAATVELGAPDDALLAGVLAKLFADRQVMIDPKLIPFIAERMDRSLDAANRIVAAIDREAMANKGRISRTLLQTILDRPGFGASIEKNLKTADLADDLAHEEYMTFGVPPDREE